MRRTTAPPASSDCRQLRILLITDDPNDSTVGIAKALHKLQAAFRALGHHCDAIFAEDLGSWPRSERARFPFSAVFALCAARRAWKTNGPYDVIDCSAGEVWLIALARRCGAFRNARIIARSHGLDHIYYAGLVADARAGQFPKPWYRRLWFPLARLSQTSAGLRLADAVILLNHNERAFALNRRWQKPENLHVIPHGTEPERWASAPAPDAPRGRGILFSGAWYTGKGIHDLAAAHRLLVERGLTIPLTILGPGRPRDPNQPPDPNIESQIEAMVRADFAPCSQPLLRLEPRRRDEDAVYAFYRDHDLLVCPSTAEGFGMVVFEAVSQRLPVVTTSAVGATDWLTHAETAYIVPPRNPAALAAALAALWLDPALRRVLADRAHAHMANFTWCHAAEQTLTAYGGAR